MSEHEHDSEAMDSDIEDVTLMKTGGEEDLRLLLQGAQRRDQVLQGPHPNARRLRTRAGKNQVTGRATAAAQTDTPHAQQRAVEPAPGATVRNSGARAIQRSATPRRRLDLSEPRI